MRPLTIISSDRFVSGRLTPRPDNPSAPLLVCIHGGGCNGRYFDLKTCSLIEAAAARGFAVLAIDRPGYGGNPPLPSITPVRDSAPVIRDFIAQVRAEHLPQADDVALIGHSIGGAIAILIAAAPAPLPLGAIAFSGIGDCSPEAIRSIVLPKGAIRVSPPETLTELLFHDPQRSLKWQAVASLRATAEDWLVAEVEEIVGQWPTCWREHARRVEIPVHLRLAEADRIWESGPDAVARMASAFERATIVDHALLPDGGHLYEATRRGPELVANQIDFVARHCALAGQT